MKNGLFVIAISLISLNLLPAAREKSIEVIFVNKINGKVINFVIDYPGNMTNKGDIYPGSVLCYELNPGALNIRFTGAGSAITISPNRLEHGDVVTVFHNPEKLALEYKIDNVFKEAELKQKGSSPSGASSDAIGLKSCRDELLKANARIRELESVIQALQYKI